MQIERDKFTTLIPAGLDTMYCKAAASLEAVNPPLESTALTGTILTLDGVLFAMILAINVPCP